MRPDEKDNNVKSKKAKKKCIVGNCENTSDLGTFVGDLCAPCHEFVTRGEGRYSQAYRNSLRLVKFRVDITDARMPRVSISLEAENVEGMGSISVREDQKPWAGRWSLSEEALRSLASAATALADHIKSSSSVLVSEKGKK